MKKANIIVLSPHLDDAALSCTDHIASWRNKGIQVTVDTIFSNFSTQEISAYQQRFIRQLKFQDSCDYGKARETEDIRAMKMLDVNYRHANFVDAGFRASKQGQPVYPGYQALTPFKVDHHSEKLLNSLIDYLSLYKDADLVYIPLGVGGHIDHVLVREAALSVINNNKIGFYVEFPYGLRFWKYRFSMLNYIKQKRLSRRMITNYKRQVLNVYQTQIDFLFKKPFGYSELLFMPQANMQKNINKML